MSLVWYMPLTKVSLNHNIGWIISGNVFLEATCLEIDSYGLFLCLGLLTSVPGYTP